MRLALFLAAAASVSWVPQQSGGDAELRGVPFGFGNGDLHVPARRL